MGEHKIYIGGKALRLHGAIVKPDFRTARVLCDDPWDYVALWLKREHQKDALFYWEQSKQFFQASCTLPELSSPLTSYYCFLNATKALLTAKAQTFTDAHGVSGKSLPGHSSLANELLEFKGAGILPALCKYLNEPDNSGKTFALKQVFYQMPFIHRAYCLSYQTATELFLPLTNSAFYLKDGSKEAWFQAEIDVRYVNAHTARLITPGFEHFVSNNKNIIRRKRRFRWSGRSIETSAQTFLKFHNTIRKRIVPIFASENRWYLKKSVSGHNDITNSQLVLMFAAMHRISELSRYNPISLAKHFTVNHNWLLSEFIRAAPAQFVYGIASEITGLEFIRPDAF